jgi:hypothetical protein
LDKHSNWIRHYQKGNGCNGSLQLEAGKDILKIINSRLEIFAVRKTPSATSLILS